MAVSQWTPQATGLKEICELLAEYQKPSANHAQIYQRIEEYGTQPEFSNYLAYLLVQGSNFPCEVRQCAGLLLKNKLRSHIRFLPEENLTYIHGMVLQGLSLPSPSLRQTAGTVISTIVCALGLLQQPGLVVHLAQLLNSDDVFQKEGALDAIHKICEDCPEALEALLLDGNEPVVQLIYLIINEFFHDNGGIRRLAVASMNIIIGHVFSSQERLIRLYREGLFRLNVDTDARIRKEVCYGMTQLVIFHQEYMIPHLKDVIRFMLESTRHEEVSVVIESCEFWTAFVDANLEPTEMRPILGELLPILLNNMVYEDDDEAVLLAREAEEEKTDGDSNLRPFIPETTGGGVHDDHEGDDSDEPCSAWTLRKCSAAGLDKLSTMFGNELLQHVLPFVQQRTQSPDWKQRECAILILGAISDGCQSALEPLLQEVVQEIHSKTSDPDPLVRIIAFWALSRYAERVMERAQTSETGENDIDLIFDVVLKSLHDKNREVQRAVCSALATISEDAGAALLPRLHMILENLATAFRRYGKRNLRILYDAVTVLAENVGMRMAEVENRNVIMPPLLQLYEQIGDDDKELQPLFACLSSLASSFGNAFEEYAVPIYNRCLRIVNAQLTVAAEGGAASAALDDNFVVCSLDLVSGMVEGIGTGMECLVGPSNLVQLLLPCCQSPNADIRQSAFALLGDLAKICPSHLAPFHHHLLAASVRNFGHQALAENALAACNNACWALGEMSLHCQQEQIQAVAKEVLENCVNVIMNSRCLPRNLVENATITLGRVAILCAPEFAPHLHVFVAVWCQMMRNIRDDVEKEQAFRGLFKTLALNLHGAANSFPSICLAVASWNYGMGDALKAEIGSVMRSMQQILEQKGEWSAVWAQVPPAAQAKLQDPNKW